MLVLAPMLATGAPAPFQTPRVSYKNCADLTAILAGWPNPIGGYEKLSDEKAKGAAILSQESCDKLMAGVCKDTPDTVTVGKFSYPCSEWAQDYNGDGVPDCSTLDTDYIKSCDGQPAPAGGNFGCEPGGYVVYDAGGEDGAGAGYYYYPRDNQKNPPGGLVNYYPARNGINCEITTTTSTCWNIPPEMVGGMDTIRAACPVSCKSYEHCYPIG